MYKVLIFCHVVALFNLSIFAARRHASAVYTQSYLSVCRSVTSRCSTNG